MSAPEPAPGRVTLAQVNGEWQAPCGCKVHFWDGRPAVSDALLDGTPLQDGRLLYVGKASPHIHQCALHRDAQEASRQETTGAAPGPKEGGVIAVSILVPPQRREGQDQDA